MKAKRNPNGAFGWPLVPSKRFPKEQTLSCPRCGSTDVVLSTYGKLGSQQSGNTIRCKKCGNSDSRRAGEKLNPKKKKSVKNPVRTKSGTIIYGRVIRIDAQKTQRHRCDAQCKRFNHRYYHTFKPGAVMVGLKDGSILIRSSR